MKSLLTINKKSCVAGVLFLGVVIIAILAVVHSQSSEKSSSVSSTTNSKIATGITSDVGRSPLDRRLGISISEENKIDQLKRFADNVETLEKAKNIIPYKFPIPSEGNIQGVYIENGNILYLIYQNDTYIIYHKLPESLDRKTVEETFKPDSSTEATTTVRGNLALSGEPGPTNDGGTRDGGTISWFENGLHIAIYNHSGIVSSQLKEIAESMQW